MSLRQLTWRRLIPGLVVILFLAGTAGAVLAFARIGAVRGPTERMYLRTPEAHGIIVGTDVWLDGERVGRIARIAFAPPSNDTTTRLVVAMDIRAGVRGHLRRDSRAEITPGGGPLNEVVVSLSSGSSASPALVAGDTIGTATPVDRLALAYAVATTSRELPGILADLRKLSHALDQATHRLDALGVERNSIHLPVAHAAAHGRGDGIRGGTLGKLLNDSVLFVRAHHALANADALVRQLGASRGSLPLLGDDSAFVRRLRDARDELTTVRALAASPDGTVGRFAADSALGHALAAAEHEMSTLAADMKHHPIRYVPRNE